MNIKQLMKQAQQMQEQMQRQMAEIHVEGTAGGGMVKAEMSGNKELLTITIEDSGSGIPPEILRRMFEERFTTKPADQGTGLGLSIVKRLIREACGAIIIQSTAGAGAKFTVCLQTVG